MLRRRPKSRGRITPLVWQGKITMATKLDEYFANQYPSDIRDLKEIQNAIQECVELFAAVGTVKKIGGKDYVWVSNDTGWSYDVSIAGNKPRSPTARGSASTTGMIGAALKRLLGSAPRIRASDGYINQPLFSRSKLNETDSLKNLVGVSQAALSRICGAEDGEFAIDDTRDEREKETMLARFFEGKLGFSADKRAKILKELKNQGKTLPSNITAYSTTYGPDDPASLGWCWDLFCDDSVEMPLKNSILKSLINRSYTFNNSNSIYALIHPVEGMTGASAFMSLRFARLIVSFEADLIRDEDKSKYSFQISVLRESRQRLAKFFDDGLHRHLSIAEIPDSRFDAAELVFCLEGLLLCAKWQINDRVFLRVLQLLQRSQESNAFWRSETPVVALENGHVLLPISVEAAKSLLASASIYENHKKLHSPISSVCIELVRRFWRWLVGQKVEIELDGKRIFGWHSGQTKERKSIQLWETSQVLEFLLSFEHMLRFHIARITLDTSGIKNEWPHFTETRRAAKSDADWLEKKWRKFDPITIGGDDERLYSRIKTDFLDDRRGEENKKFVPFVEDSNWSMLLSGPPGTGKSTIAQKMSKALDCRLISISVSDFMASGPTQMEARAKHIFQTIEAQPFSIVLFDEFDPFMYNREKERFSKLSADFQLMTNGMLPKLQDLRSSCTVVFIFATNFIERIDPAIRRRGRFDKLYMVPLLDWGARTEVLTVFAGGDYKNDKAIRRSSCLFGFADLKSASLSARQKSGAKGIADAKALLDSLKGMSPSVELSSYVSRLFDFDKDGKRVGFNQVLVEEYLSLVFLRLEAGYDIDAIQQIKVPSGEEKSLFDELLTALDSEDCEVARKAVVSISKRNGIDIKDNFKSSELLEALKTFCHEVESLG
jgi:hypothetical protein